MHEHKGLLSYQPMTETIAFVTGANKGIGREISRQLAAKGILVLMGARDRQLGEKAVADLRTQGLPVEFIQIDVTSQPSVDQAAAEWMKKSYLQNFAEADMTDPEVLNAVIWFACTGNGSAFRDRRNCRSIYCWSTMGRSASRAQTSPSWRSRCLCAFFGAWHDRLAGNEIVGRAWLIGRYCRSGSMWDPRARESRAGRRIVKVACEFERSSLVTSPTTRYRRCGSNSRSSLLP